MSIRVVDCKVMQLESKGLVRKLKKILKKLFLLKSLPHHMFLVRLQTTR